MWSAEAQQYVYHVFDYDGESFTKGYDTCVVNTNEHSDAPHHAGPLPLEFMWLPQMAVQAGVQQTDDSCGASRRQNVEVSQRYSRLSPKQEYGLEKCINWMNKVLSVGAFMTLSDIWR